MVIVAPMTGRLSVLFGSKMVLVAGSLFAASSYLVLVLAHSQEWTMYVATGLLGIGIAMGFASMANLIIEAVPAEQTGIATGMNTNIRSIGAALGSGIATSLVIGGLLPDGFPKEAGYVLAFAVSGAGARRGRPGRAHDPPACRSLRRGARGTSRADRGGRGHRRRHRLAARGPVVTRRSAPTRGADAGAGASEEVRPLRRDAEVNLGRILDAARDVFAEQGYDAPMEAIATRADVGVGTLYRRFPTKADLFSAVVEAARQRNREIAEEVLADVAPGEAVFEFVRRCMAVPSVWRDTISAPPWASCAAPGWSRSHRCSPTSWTGARKRGRCVPTPK